MAPEPTPIAVDEVLTVAEAMEESAAEAYREAAASAAEPSVRQALLALAEMEEAHRQKFAALRAATVGNASPIAPSGSAPELLEAWLGGDVFDSAPQSASGQEAAAVGLTGWLEAGVGMEKDSIAFYSGLRELVPAAGRPTIDTIITEELHHLVTLSGLLRRVRLGLD